MNTKRFSGVVAPSHSPNKSIEQQKDLYTELAGKIDLLNGRVKFLEGVLENLQLATPRIVGKINYAVVFERDLYKLTPDDLDIAFCCEYNYFMYYSKGQNRWFKLPDGWQKLDYFVRNDLGQAFNGSYGVLETLSCYHFGSIINQPNNNLGDRYLIVNSPNAILTYTGKDEWVLGGRI